MTADGDKTVASLLKESTSRLADSSDSARLDAEVLLAHALGAQRAQLYGDPERIVRPEIIERFTTLVSERRSGRPVAQLVGTREFWSLQLKVTPDTLVPRPETELLVECALRRLPEDSQDPVCDLGTGTGAVALALASERPGAKVVATDISEPALAVARYNAGALGLERVRFEFGDWLRAVHDEQFAMIVSNPPYVDDKQWLLRRYELGYEPALALRAGRNGLMCLRKIVDEAPAHLQPGGWLLVEHGFRQGPVVAGLFQAAGFEQITTYRDLPGRPRVTEGQWPE